LFKAIAASPLNFSFHYRLPSIIERNLLRFSATTQKRVPFEFDTSPDAAAQIISRSFDNVQIFKHKTGL